MKYKTLIEVTTEAADKSEAIEIVGEYLSGNLVSGIDMRCSTRRINPYAKRMLTAAVVAVFIVSGILSLAYFKMNSRTTVPSFATLDAVQTPLKTSTADLAVSGFKKEWQDKHTKQVLNHIKHGR